MKLLHRTARTRRADLVDLVSDVERVWRTSEIPTAENSILSSASTLTPSAAATLISNHLRSIQAKPGEVPAAARALGGLGVAVGAMTNDHHHRSPVYGTWRSDLPMILVSRHRTDDQAFEWALAVELGQLIYVDAEPLERARLARDFATEFNGADLRVLAGSLLAV